jgi:hypothetical protein
MPRPLLTAAWLLAWLTTPLIAQGPEKTDSVDVLILDHDFGAVGELVRLFLNDNQVYRAELSTIDVTLELHPRIEGMRVPRVYPISDSRSPSGYSVVEIYPDQDGVYEIRPVSIQGSRISTRLRLYRDVRESRRRMAVVNQPGWELGIELAGGWHSGFLQSSAAPPPGSNPEAGSDVEACFSARNAPGIPRLNMCVLGLSYQSQHGDQSILWVYTEPRVRILGRARQGFSNWELGALLRFGVGITSAVSGAPTTFGPGIYVARHIRRNSAGSGWSLQAAYTRAFYRGFGTPVGLSSGETPQSHRVTLGVGWYQ